MKFSLYSLDERLIEGWEVSEVYYPGPKGMAGILAGHAPLIAQLTVGELRFVHATTHKTYVFAVSHGFIKVQDDNIVACGYTLERARDIDVRRAVAAQKRAEQQLNSGEDVSEDQFEKFELKLQRALVRQLVAKHASASS